MTGFWLTNEQAEAIIESIQECGIDHIDLIGLVHDAESWLAESMTGCAIRLRTGFTMPVECSECGEIYDEARGDGYCGLCPSCADASEPDEETHDHP